MRSAPRSLGTACPCPQCRLTLPSPGLYFLRWEPGLRLREACPCVQRGSRARPPPPRTHGATSPLLCSCRPSRSPSPGQALPPGSVPTAGPLASPGQWLRLTGQLWLRPALPALTGLVHIVQTWGSAHGGAPALSTSFLLQLPAQSPRRQRPSALCPPTASPPSPAVPFTAWGLCFLTCREELGASVPLPGYSMQAPGIIGGLG